MKVYLHRIDYDPGDYESYPVIVEVYSEGAAALMMLGDRIKGQPWEESDPRLSVEGRFERTEVISEGVDDGSNHLVGRDTLWHSLEPYDLITDTTEVPWRRQNNNAGEITR